MFTTTMALGLGISVGIAKERYHQAREQSLNKKDGAKHILAGYTREIGVARSVIARVIGGKKTKVVTIKVIKGRKAGKGESIVVENQAGVLVCSG